MAKKKSLGNESFDSMGKTESRSAEAPKPVMSPYQEKVLARLKASDESHGGIREDDDMSDRSMMNGEEDGE